MNGEEVFLTYEVYTPPFPDKFKEGDIAICKVDINFTDGTSHKIGDEILVQENTKSYYNVHHKYYDKKELIDYLANCNPHL